MNIKNFESYINSKILSRGKNYFKSGYVVSLEYDGIEWIAEVDGSEEYTVSVSISDNGDIISSHCDCPYDLGEYCKHEVAVFFALKDKGELLKTSIITIREKAVKENLEDILAKLDKQTLISLLLEYSETYKPMKSEIIFRYAEKTDITKSARQVIHSAVNAVKHRGYVEYRDVKAAVGGADSVLSMIEDKIDANELVSAISLAIVVAEEMMELFECCDDSNGYVGGAISNAISAITDTINAMPKDYCDTEKVFDVVFSHAQSNVYDGWSDWREELLSALIPLCNENKNRAKLENYLSTPPSKNSSEWSTNYELRQKQELQYKLLAQFEDETTAANYIEQNLNNIEFRRKAIDLAMNNKDYDKVIILCIEGEESNKQYPGIINELRKKRYIAYETLGNKPEQKLLSHTMLLGGDFDFYLKYKSLHSNDEWTTLLPNVLEKVEASRSRGIYLEIIVYEKLKPQLLAYCEKIPVTIIQYHTHLLPEYKLEVERIFSDYIRQQASRADSRNSYKEVCQLIEILDKACSGATDSLCAEIIEKYARRPAFMDEMRKIKKL